ASQSFVTAPFPTDTRVSGQFEFDLNVAAQGQDTTVAVEVDDLPPGGSGMASKDFNRASSTQAFAFTFGYIRAFYRASINPRGASYPTGGSNLTPNTAVNLSFPSTYMDFIVPAGHSLRFTFSDASPYSIAT